MGAMTFVDYSSGKTAKEAFEKAVEQAAWEHGHGGYTGTIAEKGGFKVFEAPVGLSSEQFLDYIERANDGNESEVPEKYRQIVRNASAVYDDKWGPALCIPLSNNELEILKEHHECFKVAKGEKLFIFCGWASS